jgi:solute carrier family 25 (mitochondrial carnitine/acylcarnitine transporter), member 20/29
MSSTLVSFSPALTDFIAGWCSGAAAVIVCQPVDTILTRRQAGASLVLGGTNIRSMVSTAGFTSLWRGSNVMIGAVPFQNALLMAGYGIGKRSESYWGVFLGGCCGGMVQSFFMSPVELVKVKQQTSLEGKIVQIGKDIMAKSSAWRGLGATLLRDGIPHGVWFASYEYCKTEMNKSSLGDDQGHKTVTIPIVSGAVAATTAWGVGYPFDLIKTRIQASDGAKGILETAVELQKEGNLYRGFGLKLVRSVPASMIGFFVYEFVSGQMNEYGGN